MPKPAFARLFLLAGCLIALAPAASSAQGTPAPFTVPVVYRKLPNGLRVVISENHASPAVCVEVMYRIGFRIEPKNRTGAMTAMGEENQKKFQGLVSDSIMSSETSIYAFSPKMSNVGKDIASADPEFWTPKPKPAPKPAAPGKAETKPPAKQ